jgi:RNA polymerase sigma-70 factor (ECF subfamily)
MTEGPNGEAAFRQAALACLDGLYAYAMSLCHNHAEAEDLVQETYLKAVAGFAQLATGSHIKSWMYAIARNAWLNILRRRHSSPFVESDEDCGEGPIAQARSKDDPHATYVGKIDRQRVRAAIEQLPLLYREVIVLREFEELSYHEIAEIVGCPEGTVMSRLARGRDRLRVLLSDRNAGGKGA